MNKVNQLSLSDLISGLTYFENFASKLESFLISAEKKEIYDAEDIGDIQKSLSSIREKIMGFRKEIHKRMFSKSENIAITKSQNKISDDERIERYIKTTLRKGYILKGSNHFNSTDYRKLNDFYYLADLLIQIQKMSKSKHNYSLESRELLRELEIQTSLKLNSVKRKKETTKKQPKNIEYKDEIDYQTNGLK